MFIQDVSYLDMIENFFVQRMIIRTRWLFFIYYQTKSFYLHISTDL